MKELLLKPMYQALTTTVLSIILLILFRIMSKPEAGWNSSVLLILLFCLWNALAGVFVTGIGIYILKSIVIIVILFILSILLSSAITGVNLDKLGPASMIYIAPIIIYPVLLLMMLIARLIKNQI